MRLAPVAGGTAAAARPSQPDPSDLQPAATIDIPTDWTKLCKENPVQAHEEQSCACDEEFQNAFAAGLVAAGFERSVRTTALPALYRRKPAIRLELSRPADPGNVFGFEFLCATLCSLSLGA